jgi:lipopolysaccharide/colanic/teichoic acid biosynthesis glycosyltransferase
MNQAKNRLKLPLKSLRIMYSIFKRGLDLFIAIVALIIFSPFLIPVAILLRLTGEGEVFYTQERIGYKNKPFNILKFATMLKNSPNIGTGDVTVKNDPRVLPMGGFLRKTKLNELPQIINVLNGTMSIVGARPLMQPSFDMYSPDVKKVIYNTPPGITGVGSLIFRDEETIIAESGMEPRAFYEKYILPYKGAVEIWYQQNKSIWLDIQIIFLTAWAIVFPKSQLQNKVLKSIPKRNF